MTAPEPDPIVPDPPPEPDDTGGNSEAAKYRRQLRDAEAQRDTLAAAVEALQRGVVEDLAARAGITKPASLWNAENFTLAELLGDDNRPDVDKVAAAVKLAAESLGLRVRAGLPPAPNSGRGDAQPKQASWSEFLKKR